METVGNWNKQLEGMLVEIEALEEDPENARAHDEQNIDAIKESFRAFGQQKPIVVLDDGTVIAGNGSLAAVRDLGWTHIAAVQFDSDDREKAIAFALADNRTAELAVWDRDQLEASIQALAEIDFDLDLDAIGFSEDHLATLLERVGDDDYSEFDSELNRNAGLEEVTITIVVPKKHADRVVEFLADGEAQTGPGLGKGVMRKCGLL
jgi:hypothetical protein